MNLEVWTEPEPRKEEPTRVKLVPGDITVGVYAVDAKGRAMDRGLIGTLSSEGFHRCDGVSPDLGFALDEKGRILDI